MISTSVDGGHGGEGGGGGMTPTGGLCPSPSFFFFVEVPEHFFFISIMEHVGNETVNFL